MLQKRMFKVLAPIPKQNGGVWWMRCGTGHTNKDQSINIYLDAVPKDLKFMLRELDDEELRKIESHRATSSLPGISTNLSTAAGATGVSGDTPF